MARPTLSRVRHVHHKRVVIAATCEQRRAERCLVPEAAARHKNHSRAIVRDAEAGDPRKAFRSIKVMRIRASRLVSGVAALQAAAFKCCLNFLHSAAWDDFYRAKAIGGTSK